MRRVLALLFVVNVFFSPIADAKKEKLHLIVVRNAAGGPLVEGLYRETSHRGKPALQLVESYCYGPFAYRCMSPEFADHGGVKLRYYLRQPTLCYVPFGYKVCLKPAHVYHGKLPVLPYIYDDTFQSQPCHTAVPNFSETVYYREASLIPVLPKAR